MISINLVNFNNFDQVLKDFNISKTQAEASDFISSLIECHIDQILIPCSENTCDFIETYFLKFADKKQHIIQDYINTDLRTYESISDMNNELVLLFEDNLKGKSLLEIYKYLMELLIISDFSQMDVLKQQVIIFLVEKVFRPTSVEDLASMLDVKSNKCHSEEQLKIMEAFKNHRKARVVIKE